MQVFMEREVVTMTIRILCKNLLNHSELSEVGIVNAYSSKAYSKAIRWTQNDVAVW